MAGGLSITSRFLNYLQRSIGSNLFLNCWFPYFNSSYCNTEFIKIVVALTTVNYDSWEHCEWVSKWTTLPIISDSSPTSPSSPIHHCSSCSGSSTSTDTITTAPTILLSFDDSLWQQPWSYQQQLQCSRWFGEAVFLWAPANDGTTTPHSWCIYAHCSSSQS